MLLVETVCSLVVHVREGAAPQKTGKANTGCAARAAWLCDIEQTTTPWHISSLRYRGAIYGGYCISRSSLTPTRIEKSTFRCLGSRQQGKAISIF